MLDASAHFFRLPFSPSFFFRPESRYFFSVESTPENSRRHLVVELLITASLHVTRPILFFPLFSPSLSFFFRCPTSNFEVCTYVRQLQSSHSAHSIARHETRPFAWCRLASCRVAPRRWDGVYRITSTSKRCVAPHILEDHPARQYEITFVK